MKKRDEESNKELEKIKMENQKLKLELEMMKSVIEEKEKLQKEVEKMKKIDEEFKKQLEKMKIENLKLKHDLEMIKKENETNKISLKLTNKKLIEEGEKFKQEFEVLMKNEKSKFLQSINIAFSKLSGENMQQNPINYSSSLKTDLKGIYISEKYVVSDRDFCQDFICLICSEIVIDPKSCKKCEKFLCSNCLDQFLKNSSKCPHCRLDPIEVTQLSRVVKNIINSLKIKCPKDCETSLKYEELEKHLSECKFFLKTYSCNNCNKEIKANGLLDDPIFNHSSTCKKACKYCKVELFLNQFPDHVDECNKRLIIYAEFFKEMMQEVMKQN